MTRLLLRAATAATTLSILISTVTAQTATSSATGAIQTTDCYSSIPSDFQSKGDYTFQTSGYCHDQCVGFSVMAITAGSTCYCGNELPSDADKTSSTSCNTPCQGFDAQMCGGTNAYQLYLTGDGTPGAPEDGSSSGGSSSSSTGSSQTTAKPQTSATSATPSVVTQSGKVVTVTASAATSAADPSSTNKSIGGSSSKVGIAVGVVVGVVAIAAIAGGLVLFLKRRRRLAIEEEHRRNAAVSKFANGGKSETSSTADQRLDPAFSTHRRNSLGSIADEQDFSRRILQVRNPDRGSKVSHRSMA